MNQISAFIERLKANKLIAGTGGLIILATTVVVFPKTVSFLPEDLAKQVWNLAHDYLGYLVGGALLFVKGHAAVGDPARPDIATAAEAKEEVEIRKAVAVAKSDGGAVLPVLLAVSMLSLTGCVSLRTWWGAHSAQVGATGSYLAKKAAAFALQTVIAAAQSPEDANHKADYLDSLAYGFRTVDKSGLVTMDDFTTLASIWTPDKPHWGELTGELYGAVRNAGGPSAQRLEFVAQGLNEAAAFTRAADAAP